MATWFLAGADYFAQRLRPQREAALAAGGDQADTMNDGPNATTRGNDISP
ncbi:hypothetical protein [Cumulibacter soli]|nr:hypothetical protein [Cumulibacter soli]